ncbi:MAG: hypothetical protein NTY64_05480, partial [Deltaproteobacteria bacterium]|nr:hypothetical protein [Deltaproteobacteria bacterium]
PPFMNCPCPTFFAGHRKLGESNSDGFVKSPSAALHCILRRCGVLPSTPHSSGIVRLASGAFYFAIHSDDFLRDHHH